jgi:hypothetical protein
VNLSLEILLPDGASRLLSPGAAVIRVGRAPDNDVVVMDSTISGHHLLIQSTGGRVNAHDLGSRNGTFLGEKRLEGAPTALEHGAELRLGPDVRIRVLIEAPPVAVAPPAWLWSAVQSRCFAVQEGVDLGELAGLELPEGPYYLRLVEGGAEIHDGDEVLTAPSFGESFQVGEHCFHLVDGGEAWGETTATRVEGRWGLRVDLASRAGPTTEVRDPAGAVRGTFQAATRVILLYLLAEQLDLDVKRGVALSEAGWADDERLSRRLWGKASTPRGGASLQVLIHRLRKDLSKLGLAGGIIEKRAGWTRLRPGILDVELVGGAGGAR